MFPRVKDVVKASEAGIEGLKLYFAQEGMIIDPSTWSGQIKKSIDNGLVWSVLAEIELIKEKFNFYKNVSKEDKGSGDDSIDGEGDSET